MIDRPLQKHFNIYMLVNIIQKKMKKIKLKMGTHIQELPKRDK